MDIKRRTAAIDQLNDTINKLKDAASNKLLMEPILAIENASNNLINNVNQDNINNLNKAVEDFYNQAITLKQQDVWNIKLLIVLSLEKVMSSLYKPIKVSKIAT